MKILIAGGTGFIGAHITGRLIADHDIVLAVRNVRDAKRRFPDAEVIACDFVKDTSIESWLPRLQGVDAVINCVGVLSTFNEAAMQAIHHQTPSALFKACKQLNIKHKIHISAMGIDIKAPIAYAQTKKSLEQELLAANQNVTILRPSFVYSNTSYGGSSLFRGLAAFPLFIPLAGNGNARFQPIHAEDLAEMVSALVKQTPEKSEILEAAGPEIVNLKSLLQKLRSWLGLRAAPVITMPFILLKCIAPLGKFLTWLPINSTTVGMMQESDFAADPEILKHTIDITGVTPRSFSKNLQMHPAGTQDLWQAKLYFFHPLVRIVLALLWICSGISGLLMQNQSYLLLSQAGIPSAWQTAALFGSCGFDIILGLLVLSGQVRKFVNYLQLATVLAYTLIISITMPILWLAPFAPIAKNIPVLICIMLLMVLGKER